MKTKTQPLSYDESIKLYKENRHKVLLQAAAEALAEKGIDNITMDELAKMAGVTKVVLYRYFKSKDALIDSILDDFLSELLKSDSTDRSWGKRLLLDNLQLVRGHQAAYLLMMRHIRHNSKYSHHFDRMRNELMEHVLFRLLQKYQQSLQSPITSRFVSDRIYNFIFDSVEHWLLTGEEENDAIFAEWLVAASRSIADDWSKTKPGVGR